MSEVNLTSSTSKMDLDNNNTNTNNIYYKVQISAGSSKLETKPSNFKGLKNITLEKNGKLYKYFYGEETDYNTCKKRLEEAKGKGYTSAFIVKFEN